MPNTAVCASGEHNTRRLHQPTWGRSRLLARAVAYLGFFIPLLEHVSNRARLARQEREVARKRQREQETQAWSKIAELLLPQNLDKLDGVCI